MRYKNQLAVCLALALTFSACDLFKPRDSETPTGSPANAPAFAAEAVIANIRTSFSGKNVNDYAKLFADTSSGGKSYVFVPTQKAAATYAGFFSRWGVDAELSYFRKAVGSVSAASTPDVVFSQTPTITEYHSDSTLYETDYTVYIAPTTYKGQARFYMSPNKNTAEWAIYRWEDLPPNQDSTSTTSLTWSDLKGKFSQ